MNTKYIDISYNMTAEIVSKVVRISICKWLSVINPYISIN